MKFFLILILLFAHPSWAGLKILTYNMALDQRRVDHSDVRLSFANDYLFHSGADVLCLQEVWKKEDKDYLINSLSHDYLYNFSSRPSQTYTSKSPACGPKVLFGDAGILSCLNEFCLFKNKKGLGPCFRKNCPSLISPLINKNKECAQALLSSNHELNFLSFLKLINPFKGGAKFSHQGNDGLLILSKKPIESSSVIDLSNFSTFYRRGALEVEIDKHKIYCTQLSSDLDYFLPYMGPMESWVAESTKQAGVLIESMKKNHLPTILLGSISCSYPHKENFISPYNSNVCQMIQDEGFQDHLFENNPECTYCASNNLIMENRQDSFLLDHIFTKNIKVKSSKVIFKERVQFTTEDGESKETQLSTNHGVFMEIE
ncbi:MAG: endonuclease/exonuclease/phosphatase family protein [Bacteriovoracaceae bacterium]